MKVLEKEQAILLRQQGKSLNEIVSVVGVSKASVSLWVRDISLSDKQKEGLSEKGRSKASIEKRRNNRIFNTKKRDNEIIQKAKNEIADISPRDIWMLGIALYIGEGGKTRRGTVRIASSDPVVMQMAIRFFKEICQVPHYKFHGTIHAHERANVEEIEQYWSDKLCIPRNMFSKTYTKQSIASKKKRKTTPYGTFELNIHDTSLYLRIMAWINRVKEIMVS